MRKDDSCKFRKKAGCERKQTKRTYSCSAIVDKIKCSFHNSLNVNEFNRQPAKDQGEGCDGQKENKENVDSRENH